MSNNDDLCYIFSELALNFVICKYVRRPQTARKLHLKSINEKLDKQLESAQVESIFDKFWPDINAKYKDALANEPKQTAENQKGREDRELLEEIIKVRSIERHHIGLAGRPRGTHISIRL